MTEFETEYRDAAVVKDALDLDAEPVFVKMVGRNVAFEYPVSGEDE